MSDPVAQDEPSSYDIDGRDEASWSLAIPPEEVARRLNALLGSPPEGSPPLTGHAADGVFELRQADPKGRWVQPVARGSWAAGGRGGTDLTVVVALPGWARAAVKALVAVGLAVAVGLPTYSVVAGVPRGWSPWLWWLAVLAITLWTPLAGTIYAGTWVARALEDRPKLFDRVGQAVGAPPRRERR